jgi:subfamily B ATP-binding cassette protein MsbA
LFIEKNQTLIFVIPLLIILAFAAKGSSLYLAKVIMIGVAEDVRKDIQNDLLDTIIKSDTQFMDENHSGNFIANLTNDVNMIINLVSNAILNLFKDSLTFGWIAFSYVLSKLEIVSNCNHNDTFSKLRCKIFG